MRKLPLNFPPTPWIVAVMLVLNSCAVGPNFVRPTAPAADRYTVQPLPDTTLPVQDHTQRFIPDTTLQADWWTLFQSPPLNEVVQQVMANNPTLQASEANLRESQDNLRAGYGVFYPQVNASGAATRQRSAHIQDGSQNAPGIYNVFTVSGTISYALDVFGGERRAVESLQAQTENQRNQTKAIYLTLSGNVIDACIARAAYSAEIRTTQELIALENQQLLSTQVQVKAGITPYSSVLTILGAIAANEATLAPLAQSVSQTEDLLATLEGVAPEKVTLPEIDLTKLTLPLVLPISLPSELVNQRPDILSAEAALHVASAQIGVATALMFPSFNLSGSLGIAGNKLDSLSVASGKFWSVGPSVTVPVFQGTTLWYGRKAAIAAFQQAQANYRQTVLAGFAQVADSLHALEHDAEALKAQVEAKQVAAEALHLLQINAQAGLIADVPVLAADIQLHQVTIAYFQAVALRHQDTVALFVALGGGWWNKDQTAEVRLGGRP